MKFKDHFLEHYFDRNQKNVSHLTSDDFLNSHKFIFTEY